jgi:hypothetical protein
VIVAGLKTSNDSKLVVKLFLGLSIFIGGFYVYAKMTCGPNSADVKVMKPMAEKISAYIVKNGIPKSLKDIPDLPYGLEGCERSEVYTKHRKIVYLQQKASTGNFDNKCYFLKKRNKYIINSHFTYLYDSKECEGMIEILNLNTETILRNSYKCVEDMKLLMYKQTIGSQKDDGICNPLRQ